MELGSTNDFFVVAMRYHSFDVGREDSVRTRRLKVHVRASNMAVLHTAFDDVCDLF